LTQQFVDAVLTYHLPYATIKAINRNSLTYSFLPGKSIWQTPNEYRLIPECETFDSQSCHKFIQRNEKARLQWQLEKQLSAFECKWHTEHKKTLSHANTLE
jgi:adenosine deaminase